MISSFYFPVETENKGLKSERINGMGNAATLRSPACWPEFETLAASRGCISSYPGHSRRCCWNSHHRYNFFIFNEHIYIYIYNLLRYLLVVGVSVVLCACLFSSSFFSPSISPYNKASISFRIRYIYWKQDRVY